MGRQFLFFLVFLAIPALTIQMCPDGYRESDDGRCFFISDEGKTFGDAIVDCQSRGGELAELDTEEDRDAAMEGVSRVVPYWVSRESGVLDYISDAEDLNCYICEAPICGDLALMKPASQTSTLDNGFAGHAVDGNTNTNYADGFCTHTLEESNPTWWVDLRQSYAVGSVVITNRQDCCSERLNPFNIRIGDSPDPSQNPMCLGDLTIDVEQASVTYPCDGMQGRYLSINLPGPSRILTLCEVQVFKGVNLALGKPAFQTSTFDGAVAGRAVDGNTDTNYNDGHCTHTEGQTNPAWWVDLGQSYKIDSLVITNRQDCCADRLNFFNIHIGESDQITDNPLCGPDPDHNIDVLQSSITVTCQGMQGRYVGIRLPGPYRTLTLCEVQVFSG